jgi:starch synthase
MNLIIDDSDHPLILKWRHPVGSYAGYFIDNEEYFQRKAHFQGCQRQIFKDNDDRNYFLFVEVFLETVKEAWMEVLM